MCRFWMVLSFGDRVKGLGGAMFEGGKNGGFFRAGGRKRGANLRRFFLLVFEQGSFLLCPKQLFEK